MAYDEGLAERLRDIFRDRMGVAGIAEDADLADWVAKCSIL